MELEINVASVFVPTNSSKIKLIHWTLKMTSSEKKQSFATTFHRSKANVTIFHQAIIFEDVISHFVLYSLVECNNIISERMRI